MLAFTQLAYAFGSHELRSMASWMPFDLNFTTSALASLMWRASKGLGTAQAMEDPTNVSGTDDKPEPFERIIDVTKWVSYKLDVIADSSLIFAPGLEMPGTTVDENGKVKAPAGWKPSLAEVADFTKRFQTVSGTVDMLAEGGATCEGLTRLAKELWDRKPQAPSSPGNPGAEPGKIARIIVVIWNSNDNATWETAKGGQLLRAKPLTEDMKHRAIELHNVLRHYDGGVLIGPASAKTWKLERAWEAGARPLRA